MRQRTGREAITFGMRTGEIEGILHGARWEQYKSTTGTRNRYDEGGHKGCPMGCGCKCTLQHVVLGECVACEGTGRVSQLAAVQRALTGVDDEMIQPTRGSSGRVVKRKKKGGRAGREVGGAVMSAAEREAARGEAWGKQIQAARRALTMAIRGNTAAGEDWAAVKQLLGGVVRRPSNADSWGERETRRRVVCIAGAIGELQDIV